MRHWLLIVLSLVVASCAVVSTTRVDFPLVKTNEVSLGCVEVFEGLRRDFFTGKVRDFGRSVDVENSAEYQRLSQRYLASLKEELEKRGFLVVENPAPQSLLIRTKIGDDKPAKGLGWTAFGQGTVAIETSVYQGERMLLSFTSVANYGILSVETQVKRLTPGIVRKIEKELLEPPPAQ